MVISRKKRSSPQIDFIFPTFRPNFILISKKHLQQNETICAIFKGGAPKIDRDPQKKGARSNCLIRLTQYPPLVYGEESSKSS